MKMIEVRMIEGGKVPIYIWADEIEDGAMEQARNLARLPFVHHHVAIMPDVHFGYGMPIGGVIGCKDVISPNCVGVDIGCGMCAVKTNRSMYDFPQEELSGLLKKICHQIKRDVPVGFNVHSRVQEWDGFEHYIESKEIRRADSILPGWFSDKIWDRAKMSLGTLGGGNHFIEIQKSHDQVATIWLMLHSGSRNIGKVIADYYHKQALEMCEKWYSNIPNKDLAFLPVDSTLGQDYLRDMYFALKFAKENRRRMMDAVKYAITHIMGKTEFEEEINIHHNYANLENHLGSNVWVHRKGATSAKDGQMGIIPGSMGAPSYIVVGRGEPLSFMSCSHGAGRKMGRMKASRSLSEIDCDIAMDGIIFDGWSRIGRGKMKDELDFGESPLAYKDIGRVIENQIDLVGVSVKLLPVANVKG